MICPLSLGWKGGGGFFFRGKWKQHLHGLKWVHFLYFSIPCTNLSENQTQFGKVTWLRSLQSYTSARLFFIFLLHFMHLKRGEGACAYFFAVVWANGVGALWISRMGGGFLPSVSGRWSCLLSSQVFLKQSIKLGIRKKSYWSGWREGSFWSMVHILRLLTLTIDLMRLLVTLLWQYLGWRTTMDYLGSRSWFSGRVVSLDPI